jgi:putative transposase
MCCDDGLRHLVRTYKFRLYPNKEEERKLLWTLEQCRLAYNRFLEEFEKGERNLFGLQKTFQRFRSEYPGMEEACAHTMYNEARHLFENLRTLAEKKNRGRKVGKLRYKGRKWFKSFTFNQDNVKLDRQDEKFGSLRLSRIGQIPIRLHRDIQGKIKQVTIKHMASGNWYAHFAVEVSGPIKEQRTDKAIGIDVGLESFAVDSDGAVIENPRYLEKSLKRLRRVKRRLSRKKKGSRNREKQRIVVARSYEHIVNQRDDFLHKLSGYYVNKYDLIVTEDLEIKNMAKCGSFSRSIMDASWGTFYRYISCKAENAGKRFVQCDPKRTSIECSVCGETVPKSLNERMHECPKCGIKISRDYNASRNILKKGLEKVGSERSELTLVDIRPLHRLELMQAGWRKQEMLDSDVINLHSKPLKERLQNRSGQSREHPAHLIVKSDGQIAIGKSHDLLPEAYVR